jgi:hypothetical protein
LGKGAGPFEQGFFGNDCNFLLVGELECKRKACQSATNDESIETQHALILSSYIPVNYIKLAAMKPANELICSEAVHSAGSGKADVCVSVRLY